MACAAEALWAALAAYGERTALRDAALEWSGQRVLAEVQARRAALDALGAQRVALALDNGADWVVWDLALLASGRVCVPVPGFFSPQQQAHVLDSAGIDTLIGDPAVAARVEGFVAVAAGSTATHRSAEAGPVATGPAATAREAPASAAGASIFRRTPHSVPALPASTVKITYTSGTTGQPKGVCLDASAQLAVARSLAGVSTACGVERHLCVLPLATLLENVGGVYAVLLAGACVDVLPQAALGLAGASGFDVARFMQTLHECQPHSLILLPQLLLALVAAVEQGAARPSSLRFAAVGGARVAPGLLRRAEALGIPAFEGYGLSECASVVCVNTPGARRIGTVGRPLAHADVRLATDGEVEVRGARMLGYLGEPAPAGEWLPTGDLGHFDDGFLVLNGRKKHQFVTAFGRNVNPEWVEAELAEQAPIAQAWVHGEALAANVAVIVPRRADCADAEIDAAIAAANAVLPDYARVQRWLRADAPFTPANGLLTANGRLRRAALAERYLARIAAAADLADPADPSPFLPLANEIDA
ncbi:AMP-binding protein [Thauera sp.]|uniref:AMP-binding protein n=1 Tax=Thauera sp. TaxID=1905334 RepID=UPI002BF09823|nr:AMP-binding protein [Thauera sp.]HRP22865.1 AMP-binding protein [Thauera sp.]